MDCRPLGPWLLPAAFVYILRPSFLSSAPPFPLVSGTSPVYLALASPTLELGGKRPKMKRAAGHVATGVPWNGHFGPQETVA